MEMVNLASMQCGSFASCKADYSLDCRNRKMQCIPSFLNYAGQIGSGYSLRHSGTGNCQPCPQRVSGSVVQVVQKYGSRGYHHKGSEFVGLMVKIKNRAARKRIQLGCRAEGSGLRLGKQIETDSLPPSVREMSMKAIDNLGGRVTVGDVARNAGLKLSEAQSALQALAADTEGFLEVSDEGDVLYVFPKDYRSKLLAKSFRLKFEPALNKLKGVAEYLVRVSFGTTLIASLVIVYTSIFALLSSVRSQEDDRNNRSGGYGSRNSGFSFYISPFDLFWYWDPYYSRRRRKSGSGMNFLESVFSFVFGDGDPNEGLDEIRWQAIGEQIAAKGGVVTAEELAPFLDVPPLYATDEVIDLVSADESFVLPVLLRFDGQPEVDLAGNIVYRFPSFQRTASNRSGKTPHKDRLDYLAEFRLPFSRANKMEQTLVVALGGFNLLGVLTLGSLLKDLVITGQMSGLIPFVSKIFPLLQVYTVAFFAIPLFRWFRLQQKNNEIEARNLARKERAMLLKEPDPNLRQKVNSARKMAERTFIGKERIIYTTEKDLLEQAYDGKEWERRLEERTGSN